MSLDESTLERMDGATPWRRVSRRLGTWRAARRTDPPAVPYDWFTDAEVAAYERAAAPGEGSRIDDATWHDLDGKDLMRRLGARASIFARQHLYRRLRQGAPDAGEDGVVAEAIDDPATAQAIARSRAARALLRAQESELTPVLFGDALPGVSPALRWLRGAPVLHPVALAAWAAGWSSAALIAVLGYLAIYGWALVGLSGAVSRFKRQRAGLRALAVAAASLGEAGLEIPHPVLRPTTAALAEARRLRAALAADSAEWHPMVADYLNLLTLREFATLGRDIERVRLELAALRALYVAVAECEARLCLVEHLRESGAVCRPRWTRARTLRLRAMRHPLLAAGDPLTIDLQGRGAFITGRNGVGKSTLLRALGLNLLLARAFGVCFAQEAELPRGPVWSSLRHDDSLASGDSLYMAEMRRAQALLVAADAVDEHAVFLVDEIFRGTNPLESVAAAAAVLHRLSAHALVIVSSHNVVLAPLLADRLEPLRVVRHDAGLAIEPGVLQEPNGLEMMSRYDVGPDIRANAQRVHDWWSGHVSRPDRFPTLS
jgi:hypothetical protein